MFQHKCVDDGIVQVLIGIVGQHRHLGSYLGTESIIYHDQQFEYTTIFTNQTYLHFTYYNNSDDNIINHFILQKQHFHIYKFKFFCFV
jgi:hypothetical protein